MRRIKIAICIAALLCIAVAMVGIPVVTIEKRYVFDTTAPQHGKLFSAMMLSRPPSELERLIDEDPRSLWEVHERNATPLEYAIDNQRYEYIDVFIDAGMHVDGIATIESNDPNIDDKYTPLAIAAMFSDTRALGMLISAARRHGQTFSQLDYAIDYAEGRQDTEVLEILYAYRESLHADGSAPGAR